MANKKVIDSGLSRWCFPGIFGLKCIPTNRAYFEETELEVFFIARAFIDNLERGYCDNIELLNDYKKYGRENFEAELLVAGPEYYDEIKRKTALEDYKASWPGELY